jgi:hypothetical protein
MHVLGVASVIQQQLFYVIAPFTGLSKYTILFYYGQKASQVASEVAVQRFKESVCSRSGEAPRVEFAPESRLAALLALVPVLAAGIGVSQVRMTSLPLASAALSIFLLDVYVSSFTTLLGHAALYRGSALPVRSHLANGFVQLISALAFTRFLGVGGYPIALLVSGLLTSYRANFMLFLRAGGRATT